MPEFAYIARTTAGQRVEGVLSAATQREAVASLSARELFPMQVKAAAGRVQKTGSLKVRPQAMAQFYIELAALLRSGVPLLRSLDLLASHATHPALEADHAGPARPRHRGRFAGRRDGAPPARRSPT